MFTKNSRKFIKVFILIFLIVAIDARKSIISTKKHSQIEKQDFVSIASEGMNSISQILSGTAELLSETNGALKILKGLGPLLGAVGPALAILNIFLGDPMDKKLDEINNKVDQVLTTLDRKFQQLQDFIGQLHCQSEISNALVEIKSYTDEMRSQMQNSIEQKKQFGPAAIKQFFLRKISQGKNIQPLLKAMNQIVNLMTSKGGAAESCNIIINVSKGTQESDGLKGSTTALLQVFLPIFHQLDEGLAYILAMDEATPIDGEDVEITKKIHRREWTAKKILAANALEKFAEYLDSPQVFAANTKKNLQTIWVSISDQGYGQNTSGDWKGYDLTSVIYQKLSKVFTDKKFAVFTYRDYKENNYFKSVRKYDTFYRTKDDTASFERNYVIEVAFTQFQNASIDQNEYMKDVNCLENAYNRLFQFKDRSDSAENFITDDLFKDINSECEGRLGGITFVWQPPKGSSVLTTSHYEPTKTYQGKYQECKFRLQQWCEMNGRMYHVFNVPGWDKWRAYMWTTQ